MIGMSGLQMRAIPLVSAFAGRALQEIHDPSPQAGVFLVILWLVIVDVAVMLVRRLRNEPIQVSPEASYVRSVLPEATHA